MIAVKKEGVILRKTDLAFENYGVLNPAVIKEGDIIHLFYRAVREGNYSTIGYCKMAGPLTVSVRSDVPVMFSQAEYDSHGLEDPRIVRIDGLYYISYIAYNGTNALGALATSADLKHFEKHGIIVPQVKYKDFELITQNKAKLNEKYLRYNQGADECVADKDLAFFPRRINGKLTFLHRIKPDIQIAAVNNLEGLTKEFWENYFMRFEESIVITPKYPHEVSYVGGGCPPVETEKGWLLIYHGVKETIKGYEYSACAALLDLNNPGKEISRLPYPLFKPELDYELAGDVDDVCFPTGTVIIDDKLYIYYGAADDVIACASVSLSGLVDELSALATGAPPA